MTRPTSILYLFDPLCGWCYGAAPVLARLAALPDFDVTALPTGLFAGAGARSMDGGFAAYAWSNDQRIAALTGQIFSADYRDRVLGAPAGTLDSGPATLALTAVALTAPDREMTALGAIQRARYANGLDITDVAVLADLLRDLGLGEAADRLLASDAALLDAFTERLRQGRTAMRSVAADGVPALVVGTEETRRLVRANVLLGHFDALLADLRAD